MVGMELQCSSCCIALFLLLLLFPAFSMQQPKPMNDLYRQCLRNTTTSLLSSTFTRNLNTALLNFTSLASQAGSKYAIATTGSSGPDMVYSVFQCRGDLSMQSCGECVKNVTARLPLECPKAVGARIRLDGCFLRYDNQSFFSLDTTYVLGLCNTANTSDVVTLSTIADLMANVTSEAPKQGGWASASAIGMYADAQCLGYLSPADCAQCLSSYSYRICNSRLGAQVHLASCDFRYEAYNFLEAAPPPISAASPGVSGPQPAAAAPSPAFSLISPMPASLALPPSLVKPSLYHRHSTAGGSKTLIIAVSVSVGFVTVVGALSCALLVWRFKATKKKGKRVDKATSWRRQLLQTKAQVFALAELEEATAHFHATNKLGEGGFGIVYKGTLSNGEQVAIKKLSAESQQGKQEFLNEVNLITSVQHKNLIRLLGCCVEDPERILVYEYLPNRSLDFLLSGRNSRMLNWSIRYNIVVGTAKGLAYLHEESHIRIIHRDIKPNNILLDDQFNPVIADFGLARLVKDDATHVNTGVAGTIGYLAPEYALRGALSEKVDVFSFGLVSLEIITGKQNVHNMLLAWVWEKYQHGNVLDLVDERLGNAFSPEQVIRAVHVALLCTQENPKQRPTMSMVVIWLSGKSDILEIPSKPTFLDYSDLMAPMGEFNAQCASTSSTSSQQPTNVFGGQGSSNFGVQSLSEVVNPR